MNLVHSPQLAPSKLWQSLQAASAHALQQGALRPIDTDRLRQTDGSMQFEIRRVAGLMAKRQVKAALPDPNFNPFAQPDPLLTVANLKPNHRLLLNKFPVYSGHILVVTRDFEPQTNALSSDDWTALASVLGPLGGLAFYNAGPVAGASQAHKHLQLIPQAALDLAQSVIPIEGLLDNSRRAPYNLANFTFAHRLVPLPEPLRQRLAVPEQAPDCGPELAKIYQNTLLDLGLDPAQPQAYNLCLTKRWMLLLARRRDRVAGVSLNALAYAGFFLARDRPEMEAIKNHGPLRMLHEAAL